MAVRLSEMQKAIEVQQQQIQHLVEQVQSRDGQIQELQQQMNQVRGAASQAQQAAEAATSQNTQEEQNITAIRSDVSGLQGTVSNTALALQDTQKNVNTALESPLALHYKGITITPGGFLAAEFVRRSRALAADVNTPFNSLTVPGASQSSLSEFFGSGRQSRISMLAEGRLQSATLSGYVEADFLSAAASSNNNQSNSYSLRQRQAFGTGRTRQWFHLHRRANVEPGHGDQAWCGQPLRSHSHDHRRAVHRRFQLGTAIWASPRQELQQTRRGWQWR